MDLSLRVLGKDIVHYVSECQHAPILRIGSDSFDRGQLAHVECFNFMAAARLSRILNRELSVKNTRDVFDNVDPSSLALPGLGAVAIAVLGAAFEAKRIGGESPLHAWVDKHRGADRFVSFNRLKVRAEQIAHAATSQQRKSRRRKRRAESNGT